MSKIVVCVGTRPDFIKMAPVILKLEEREADYRILHTGQHYSKSLANVYNEFPIREPDHQLTGLENCKTHASKTALIMQGAEDYFMKEKPNVVVVQGDTDHSLACGIAARKLRIRLGHVEAGLRCLDWRVPEEHNRRMLDHISELLFAPTLQSVINLSMENVNGRIGFTGNTVMDTLHIMRDKIKNTRSPMKERYILMTIHREENVDDPKNLKKIITATERVYKKLKMPILFPAHPRTVNRMRAAKLHFKPFMKKIPPMNYVKFIAALRYAQLVLTDSGGVQEEACALHVPCVVLRDSTERVESVAAGASIVSGLNSKDIDKAAQEMISRPRTWPNPYDPFNDANAAERIVNTLIA